MEEFDAEVEGELLLLPEMEMPPLSGTDLFEVVKHKASTAGSSHRWGWRELQSLLVPWFVGLALIFGKGRRAWGLAWRFVGCVCCHDS